MTEKRPFSLEHSTLIAESYFSVTGKNLMDFEQWDLPEQMYHAAFVLLSHDNGEDPVFNYANLAAQRLFEYDWSKFVTLPSRLSAEPVNRQERQRLLLQAEAKGYIQNYQGVRISGTGRRFLIKNATIWNLEDANRRYRGQAACFNDWVYLD